MPQVLIRGLDAATMQRLKGRASAHGRSLQAELRHILEQAVRADPAAARRLARKLRRQLADRQHSDSAALLAEDRAR